MLGAIRGCNTNVGLVSKSGVVVYAHLSVLLPLSQYLKNLVEGSQACGCPEDLPLLFLPNWDYKVLKSIIKLIYTGSVIVSSDMMDELFGLIHELCLKIPPDQLAMELVRPSVDECVPSHSPAENQVREALNKQNPIAIVTEKSSNQNTHSKLLGMINDIKDQVTDISNVLNNVQDEEASSLSEDQVIINIVVKVDNDYDDPEEIVDITSINSKVSQSNMQPTQIAYNPSKSPTKRSQNFDETSLVKKQKVSKSNVNKNQLTVNKDNCEGKHPDESIPQAGYKCHICSIELGDLKTNFYYHYATVHFSEQLLADFSQQVDGQACLICGEVMPTNIKRYWFLVHMGVRHKGVDRYLRPYQLVEPSKNENARSWAVDNTNDNLEQDNMKDNEQENNWKEASFCIICEMNIDTLDLAKRCDHYYKHFKRNITVWLDGMKEIYAVDAKCCPQCSAKFQTKILLGRHLGSVHNLYQMFIKRYNDDQRKSKMKPNVNENIAKSLRQKKKCPQSPTK